MKLWVLVADGDPLVRQSIRQTLEAAGHSVDAVADSREAIARLAETSFDVLVCDVSMPKVNGIAIFEQAKTHSPGTAVVFVTSHGNVTDAVEALKAGVGDYIIKPIDAGRLRARIEIIGQYTRFNTELRGASTSDPNEKGASASLIGRSPLMLSLLERVKMVAPTDASIVISGESGTGKELVARAVHQASTRWGGPFVAINCTAFPETLIEAELFGHERGAFTGATQKREGRFKAANGGTIFLDEVGEIPLAVQAKLLRVLQEGKIEPLGSNRSLSLNVRLICATHRNLKNLIASGAFREDLYYRLNVLDIHVPPLRNRRSDLPLLVSHFYRKFAGEHSDPKLHLRAWAALMNHSFPGNVRELEHAVQHAVVLSQGAEIEISHLPADIRGNGFEADEGFPKIRPLTESMRDFERQCLLWALEATNGTKFKAASLLGISRKTLWEKLKAHRIAESSVDEGHDASSQRNEPHAALSTELNEVGSKDAAPCLPL